MESVRVFLVLLLCSLSAAENQNNEIPEEMFANVENENAVEQHEPRSADLRTELRGLNSKLSENTLMIQQLQTLNQAQAETLAKNELRIQELEQRYVVGLVAFSAELSSGEGYVGPVNYLKVLEFKRVRTNIGNGYNPSTGNFIAPVKGAYHFHIAIDVGGGADGAAMIFWNNQVTVQLREAPSYGWGIAAKSVTLILNPGDQVNVRLASNFKVHDLSAFSGHLLFPIYY